MDIILLETVDGLGKAGQELQVKAGYARNFLLPKKLALQATPENKKVFEDRKKKIQKILDKEKNVAASIAEKLATVSCTIAVKVGEEEKLFGSVTNADIAKALDQQGIAIDKKKVHVLEPIKALGVYQVDIKLHPDVTTQIKVWVVKE